MDLDISEIKDYKTLDEWLRGRSREDAVAIAARASLRVLPKYFEWSFQSDVTLNVLPVMRCALISVVATISKNSEIRSVARQAVIKAYNINTRLSAAADAAFDAATSVFSEDASADASIAVVYASDAADIANTQFSIGVLPFWREVRADCYMLEEAGAIHTIPLWHKENLFAGSWEISRQSLQRHKKNPESWKFWIDWYDAILDPISHPPDWELYEQVALIEDEV